MRKIVAGLFISLDGVVEAPETWHFPYLNDQMERIVGDQIAASDTMLFGRRTFQEFASYWPQQGNDSPLADVFNTMPKLVASNTLRNADEWQNSSVIGGEVAEGLKKLKEQPGGEISITGSATLVRSLLSSGVLDELRLLVHPIVVGSGKRLFDDPPSQVPLKLVDERKLSTGVLYLTYAPAD